MNGPRIGCAFAFVGALLLVGCRPTHHPTQHEAPYDLIVTARFDSVGGRTETLPSGAYRWRPWWNRRGNPRPAYAPPSPRSKIDPLLLQWLADSTLAKRDTLVVTYADTVTIAAFPELDPGQAKTSGTNVAALAAAQLMIANLQARRAPQYTLDSLDLVDNLGGTLLERYWITQASRIELSIGELDSLASRPNVVWIQADRTGIPPPVFGDKDDNVPGNDPIVARQAQGSDALLGLELLSGWISVLDTGVLPTHELFVGTVFQNLCDCVGGDYQCAGGSAKDVTEGHGTATSAILAANNTAYPRFRGVTRAQVDAFRIYRKKGATSELVVSAAIRGFQTTIAGLDRIIVAEMQDTSSPSAAIADAAEGAFDAGAAVLAANGNFGPSPPYPMSYPACARRVIGVGGREVVGGANMGGQSYGLTADRRQKPELQARTRTESAGAKTIDAAYIHGGTSGATPYAAGAAALVRAWLTAAQGSPVDPGQVYAQLILSSTNRRAPWPLQEGVGQIFIPPSGIVKFGKIEFTPASVQCDIPIEVPFSLMRRIDVALWWPEATPLPGMAPNAYHNNVDFHLYDPTGMLRTSGTTVDGIFERNGYDSSSLAMGRWKLRVDVKQFGRLPQVVYWTASVRP